MVSRVIFPLQCYERGVMAMGNTDGIELAWGNTAAMVAMVEDIAQPSQ